MAVAYGKGNLILEDLELKSEVISIRQKGAAPRIPLYETETLGMKDRVMEQHGAKQRGLDHIAQKYLEIQVLGHRKVRVGRTVKGTVSVHVEHPWTLPLHTSCPTLISGNNLLQLHPSLL